MFAFGIVLYELLTRQHPFRRDTPASTLEAILHDSPPPPAALVPSLSPAASGIVQRCLAKAPEDRFADASALAQALIAAAETSPDAAAPHLVEPREPDPERVTKKESGADVEPAAPTAAKTITPTSLPSPRRPVGARRWIGLVSAVVAAAAVGFAGALWLSRSDGPAPVVRTELSVKPAETLNAGGFPGVQTTTPGGTRTALRWTSDGTALVFVGRRGDVQQLFVRELDAEQARPLAGTEGASVPACRPMAGGSRSGPPMCSRRSW